MELENKKYFELNSEERKQRNKENWQKAKPIVKRVVITTFCVAICLIMVIGLLYNIFRDKNQNNSESTHNHEAIVLDIN